MEITKITDVVADSTVAIPLKINCTLAGNKREAELSSIKTIDNVVSDLRQQLVENERKPINQMLSQTH